MKRRKRADWEYGRETRLIHGESYSPHWDYADHIVPPISASVAYRLETAERGAAGFQSFANPEFNRHISQPIYIYDRLDEPSRAMLEERLALAEGGETALCFSTGMAAIAGALGVLAKAGDRIVAHHTLYGCTYSLLHNWMPRFGIQTDFVDLLDPDALRKAMGEDVMLVYFETPTNPTLDIINISELSAIVRQENKKRGKKRHVMCVVDNTFATPYCQRPLSLGADVVVHSLTKNIGGFGTDMGGAVIAKRSLEPDLLLFRKDFGAPLSPKAAWPTLVYGLPTLSVRTRRQMETALSIARFLEAHPAVKEVRYPGLSSHPHHDLAMRQMLDPDGHFAPGIMIYFVLKGEPEAAREKGRKVMDALAQDSMCITLAVSLGQVRTLVEHPSSMSHAVVPVSAQLEAGIDPGGIRMSIGLESPSDLMRDLDSALSLAL